MTAITQPDVREALQTVYGNKPENETTLRIFDAIRWYKDKEGGYIPGRVLENYAKCSGATATKHVKRLEDCGVVKVTRSRDLYNRYELRSTEDVNVAVARQLRIAVAGGSGPKAGSEE